MISILSWLTFRALPCVLNVLRVNGLIGPVNKVALVYDVLIVHPKVQLIQQVVGTPAIAYNRNCGLTRSMTN